MNQQSLTPTRRNARLTNRESEVLALIADGHRNEVAADLLFISKRTVDYHLSTIYLKFGVSNRMQAVRVAREHGLLPINGGTPTENFAFNSE